SECRRGLRRRRHIIRRTARRARARAAPRVDRVDMDPGRLVPLRLRGAPRPAERDDDAGRLRRRRADRRVLDRLHGRGQRGAALLRVHVAVRLLDAPPRPGREPGPPACRLGMVGLSSYLLIGFWHERPSAVAAAKKAFVMNAVGDATMALAFFMLIQKTGTLDFGTVFARTGGLGGWAINLIALGLLGGAVAKSA